MRKLLRIDLSTGLIVTEPVEEQTIVDFIGGRGFGVNYLYRELAPAIDPLSEHNKLLLLAGPLAGTNVQAASRWMACTKSPLTGAFARSVAGADFGAWLRWTGYEFIILEGKAEKPVYVYVNDDTCEIKDASELWGKDTRETQRRLECQHGKNTRAACIGPAGENLVKYAAIVSGRRTAGRCGTGTVMGSKNLKAVVVNARRNSQTHDPATLKALVQEQIGMVMTSNSFSHHKDMGTTGSQGIMNDLGIYPVRNFRYGQQQGYQNFSGEEYRRLRTGEFGCYGCPAHCGKIHTVTAGQYAGACSEGPEYESIWAFTGPIDSTNIEATIAADQICDDLGLDTMSAGNTIGFTYELFERGIITPGDTDGMELTYGNHKAMIILIKMIANREGIGDILAEGSLRAAARFGKGAESYAMHVKGLELPAYDPRGAKSQGFNYVTASIGASHNYGYARQEIFGVPDPRVVDRFTEDDKADIVKLNQHRIAMAETGIICAFSMGWGWFPDLYNRILAAVTGIDKLEDVEYLWEVGERIFNLERAFNVREGFSRTHDNLPNRLITEPLHTGDAEGEGQMVRHIDAFLDKYYELRGWTEDGIPSADKLEQLNLSFVSKDMNSKI